MHNPSLVTSDPSLLSPRQADLVRHWLRGRSQATRDAYGRDLADFARHIGAASLDLAASELLGHGAGHANGLALDYQNHLIERGLAPATVNRRLAALRSVTKMARMLGLVAFGIEVEGVRSESYRDTRGPGIDVVRTALAHLSSQPDTMKTRRDSALVLLMSVMGLRSGEVLSLDICHVETASLMIRGKGRSNRERVTMPPQVAQAVQAWMELHDGTGSDPLFIGMVGARRLSPSGLRLVLRDLAWAIGEDPIRPHGLRHTAITGALDSGRDVREVARFSRHKQLQTVVRYDDNRRDFAGQIAAGLADKITGGAI